MIYPYQKDKRRTDPRYKRGPPRGFGEQRNKGIYFRETRKQRSKNEGNGETKAILGNREHIGNRDFDFGEQRNKAIYLRERGNR